MDKKWMAKGAAAWSCVLRRAVSDFDGDTWADVSWESCGSHLRVWENGMRAYRACQVAPSCAVCLGRSLSFGDVTGWLSSVLSIGVQRVGLSSPGIIRQGGPRKRSNLLDKDQLRLRI